MDRQEENIPGFHHRPLPDYNTLLAGREPPDEVGFRSQQLQIWHNNTEEPWSDPVPHAHKKSDECFVVLRGTLDVEVEGERFTIGTRKFCCFARGVYHAVVAVHPPVESLMIRAPSVDDKVYHECQGSIDRSYSVYILSCADDAFYTGMTNDLDRRLSEHRAGRGSKWVALRLPVEVDFCLDGLSWNEAHEVEQYIKRLSRARKQALIDGDARGLALVEKRKTRRNRERGK